MIGFLAALLIRRKPSLTMSHARRLAKIGLIGAGVLLLVILAVLLWPRDSGKDQIEHANQSSAAIADAAEDAIQTLEDRTATEDAVDQATQEALTEIEQAADPVEVRNAVLAVVCGTREHRNDPACVRTTR